VTVTWFCRLLFSITSTKEAYKQEGTAHADLPNTLAGYTFWATYGRSEKVINSCSVATYKHVHLLTRLTHFSAKTGLFFG
jgi:hypothetical protein